MTRLALILALAATSAAAQNFPAMPPTSWATDCTKPEAQDVLTIEDDGPHIAVLTYSNAAERCSDTVDRTMRSQNGIAVTVRVIVADRETLEVIPHDPQYHAHPSRIEVEDGESVFVIVMAGTS